MRIVCPQCGYSRDIPSDKVPASSSIATCPKCQFRFRFRGNQPSVQPEPTAEEPVYPPSPSRPARPAREPEAASRIHAPYEPRSQRAYMPEPDAEPEHYGHIPPRPQARWLPDEEPDQFSAQPFPAEHRRAPQPRQEYGGGPDHPFGRPDDGRTPAPRGMDDFEEAPRLSRSDRPERAMRQAARTTQEAPACDPPVDFPGAGEDVFDRQQPFPPVDRLETAMRRAQTYRPEPRQQAAPDEFGRLGADSPERSDLAEHDPLPREYAMPVAPAPGVPISGRDDDPDGVPDDQQDPQAPQPGEAVAGEDSVRDIWARLQAMGGQPPQGRAAAPAARQAQAEPGMEAHQPKAALPYAVAPWEQLELYGAVPSLLNTVKNVLLKPGDFFDQLPPFSGKIRPLLFANVVCLASVIFGLIWFRFGLGPNLSDLGRTDGFQGLGAGMIGSLAWLGLSPILVTAFVFLDSALGHLLLGLLRSASKPFEETFRTICYAGAPWMLTLLPVSWQYLIPIVLIWHMTLQAIGLKKLHQAGYPQVLASVLVKWSLYFMASFAVLHVLLTRR